jgi:hypothetical protein
MSSSTRISSPIAVVGSSSTVRATADPNIFRNERVLRALIRREMKHGTAAATSGKNYFG